jgi:hypothetical protein
MTPIKISAAVLALSTASSLGAVVCEQSDEQIVVTRDGHHVLTYNKTVEIPPGVGAKYGRSGFIHPISTPSGKVLTDGYPLPHHSHQNGVFFAWRNSTFEGETLNFWEPSKAQVRHEKILEIVNSEEFAGFRVELAHVNGKRVILRETWTVMVHSDTGHIDLKSEQRCATESALTLNRFHYGGMAIRGSRQWFKSAHTSAGRGAVKDEFVEACKIITSEGVILADANHSRPNWVCMTGKIDGAPASITVVPHPGNIRHPQHVRLHPDMPYFCFIPTVEMPLKIEPGEPLVSRFRIVAEDGKPDATALDAVQQSFALEE